GLLAGSVGFVDNVPVLDLADQAQAVVVGTIEGVRYCERPAGAPPGGARLATLRVLKGDVKAPGILDLSDDENLRVFPETWYGTPTGPHEATDGHSERVCSGLWFLKRSSGTGWEVIPAYGSVAQIPAPAAPLPQAWTYGPHEALIDKLVCELRAAFESSDV